MYKRQQVENQASRVRKVALAMRNHLPSLHHLKLKLHHLPPHHIAKVILPKSPIPRKSVHQKLKPQPSPESQQLHAHRNLAEASVRVIAKAAVVRTEIAE